MKEINDLVQKQRIYFLQGNTKNVNFRINALVSLKKAIKTYESEILDALKSDLNKSEFEAFITEIGIVLEEINYMLNNVKRFVKPKRVSTPLMHFKSSSRVINEPYGSVLIISPWNYPFQLSLVPLIGAIAGGNCVILKPSEYATASTRIIVRIIKEVFPPEFVSVVEGGAKESQYLLEHKFDMIFFTGSVDVGRIVMNSAAKHLTPVVLELGGKSPCIVDETANIKLAAKRIVWGKCLNAGQTCVAPDYLLVHKSVKKQLIEEMKKITEVFFGNDMHNNTKYPKIISERHYTRIKGLINTGKVVYGGNVNDETRQIGLTIMDEVDNDDLIMKEEIFGPILPVLEYSDLETAINLINKRPKPLALYMFTTSNANEEKVVNSISFGGGCINDTIVHLTTKMGFGGIGESGIGKYHGKTSLEAFTHAKAILKKSNIIDTPFRYAPYNRYLKVIKKIMK